MEGKNKKSDSKYLLLWVCVIIAGAIIFGGWIYSLKYSLAEMDKQADKSKGAQGLVEQMNQAAGQMQEVLKKEEKEEEEK